MQIGRDYCVSWRPNPAQMVCCGWDEASVRAIVRAALEAMRGCFVHVNLKDVMTVEGDIDRLRRWTAVVRQEIDRT